MPKTALDRTPFDADLATGAGMALLADGVPLSLLLDLAAAVPSRELYRHEPGDARWLTPSVA
jgi:hypothetical protein